MPSLMMAVDSAKHLSTYLNALLKREGLKHVLKFKHKLKCFVEGRSLNSILFRKEAVK